MGHTENGRPTVRYCPYCGQPLGSFFGTRIEGGAFWCEPCQECFRVEDVNRSEADFDPPSA